MFACKLDDLNMSAQKLLDWWGREDSVYVFDKEELLCVIVPAKRYREIRSRSVDGASEEIHESVDVQQL